MGLFSYVINQCQELGPEFMGILQTKDLQCYLESYWLSPAGDLYEIDDASTYELKHSGYRENGLRMPMFERVPTGQHGRVKPFRKSGLVRLTAEHEGKYLECLVHFKMGMLTGVLCRGPIFSCDVFMDGSIEELDGTRRLVLP